MNTNLWMWLLYTVLMSLVFLLIQMNLRQSQKRVRVLESRNLSLLDSLKLQSVLLLKYRMLVKAQVDRNADLTDQDKEDVLAALREMERAAGSVGDASFFEIKPMKETM